MTTPLDNPSTTTPHYSPAVRVRFAPSPTGIIHLGNLRTALFNWLYARGHDGQFILRIEDTDQERRVPGALEQMMDDLRWLGLDWDEGPDLGGPHAPYIQSERLDLYRESVARLLASDAAYYCDCSPERLDDLRQQQSARGEMPRYDGRCRTRDLGPGAGRVIRFKLPLRGDTVVHDVIHGESVFANTQLSDPVLIKSDGFPTYHLAAVIDDHDMRITHVLRADEWLSSLPLHVRLYEAFGWEPPQFVHLPLIVDLHGRKLKKRPEDLPGVTADYLAYAHLFRIQTLREEGYLPEGVMNYLALLGWNPGTEEELFTPEELIARFSLDRVSPGASRFDADRLDWFNRQHLARLDSDALGAAALPFLRAAYDDPRLEDPAWPQLLVETTREKMTTLSQAPTLAAWAFHDPAAYGEQALAALRTESAGPVLAALADVLPPTDGPVGGPSGGPMGMTWANETLRGLMKQFKQSHGWGGKQVLFPLRAALTGTVGGPHLTNIVALLDAATLRRRVEQAVVRSGK